ncbi:MAG: hypothetical protein ABSH28_08555 [Acidobacteriota bacterium]
MDAAEVRIIIADVYFLPIDRVRFHQILAAAVDLDKQLGKVLEADDPVSTQIENLAGRASGLWISLDTAP